MIKNILLPIYMLLLSLGAAHVQAQGCGCTNCPQIMEDEFSGEFNFQVYGADSNDLASPNQGICGIHLSFVHQYLGDLNMTLISPSGQEVHLVGPVGISGVTSNSTWDVSFVPCGETATPDPGISATWDNQEFLTDGIYTGSYYPAVGCLEDFDFGSVNGTWTLTVEDAQYLDTGVLIDYSIEFCNDSGITCLSCDPPTHVISPTTSVEACEGSLDLDIDIEFNYTDSVGDIASYLYSYVLSRNDTILSYTDEVDLSSHPPGTYTVRGLSYHQLTEEGVPGTMTLYSDLMLKTNSDSACFCGSLSDNELIINVLEVPDTVFVWDTICEGEEVIFNNTMFSNSGRHVFDLTAVNGCDSTIVYELTVMPNSFVNLSQTICQGEYFQVGDSIYTVSGNYENRLLGAASNECDSIVNLSLEVLDVSFSIVAPDTLTCARTTVRIDGRNTTHNNGAIFRWEFLDGGTGVVSGRNTKRPLVNRAGNYQFAVTFIDSITGDIICSFFDTVWVPTNAVIPVAEAGEDILLNCDFPVGVLDGSMSTSGMNIQHEWYVRDSLHSNAVESQVIDSGLYLLHVIDTTNGCISIDSVLVRADFTEPDPFLEASYISCYTDFSTLEVTNPIVTETYEWRYDGNFLASDFRVESPHAGMHQLIATGENGCTAMRTITVQIDTAQPEFQVIPAELSCNQPADQHQTLSIEDYEYRWTDENGNSLFNEPYLLVSDTQLYFVIVTNPENGCTQMDSVRAILDADIPHVSVDSPNAITCVVTTSTLQATIADSTDLEWEWRDDFGNLLSNTFSHTVSVAGSYHFIVTNNANGCVSDFTVVVKEDMNVPTINAIAEDTLSCQQVDVRLRVQSPPDSILKEYAWYAPSGDLLSTDSFALTEQAGSHRIIVRNSANGCESEQWVVVDIDTSAPAIYLQNPDTLTCLVHEVNVSASVSEAASLQWYAGPTLLAIDTQVIAVQNSQWYLLQARSLRNGCVSLDSVYVPMDRVQPQVTAMVSDTLTCTVTEVILTAVPNNVDGYKYTWYYDGNFLSNNATITASQAGEYELQCTDVNNGCFVVELTTVAQDTVVPKPLLNADAVLNCIIDTISLVGSTQHPDHRVVFQWRLPDGQLIQGNSFPATQAGMYELIITDTSNGCVSTLVHPITVNRTLPNAHIQGKQELNCIDTVLTLSSAGSSQGDDISYRWFNASAQPMGADSTLSLNVPGTFTLLVTDEENGCTQTAVRNITQDTVAPTIYVPLQHPPSLTCTRVNFVLDANGSQPNGLLDFTWQSPTGPAFTPTVTVEQPGTYSLRVLNDDNGCESNFEIEVYEDNYIPQAVITSPDTLTCSVLMVDLEAILDTVDSDFTYIWTAPSGPPFYDTATIAVEQGGNYTLRILNPRNDCENTFSVTVPQDTAQPLVSLQAPDELTCSVTAVEVMSEGSSQGYPFTYQWSTPMMSHILSPTDAPQITVNESAVYTLRIENEKNGCVKTRSVVVSEEENRPEGAAMQLNQPTCFDAQDGTIRILAVQGGVPPFAYFFNQQGPLVDPIHTDHLSEGTYEIAVEDANGCTWDTVIQMSVPDPLNGDLGADLSVENGDVVTLSLVTSRAVDTASWIQPSYLATDILQGEVQDTPNRSTTYQLMVSDSNGCSIIVEKRVIVRTVRRVYAPNIFSPNGDGQNDVFYLVLGKGVRSVRNLQLFNRWGEQVFATQDIREDGVNGVPSYAWNGIFKGEAHPPAVLVYKAEVEFTDGKIELLSGNVSLIR